MERASSRTAVAAMCSAPMSRAADMHTIRARCTTTVLIAWAYIAATTGEDILTTAGTRRTIIIPRFMDGRLIPGRARCTGALAHGDGEDRGGASTRAGGIRIRLTRLPTSG